MRDPTEQGSPAPEVVTPTERGSPAPEAHRTIAGGKRGEAERAHRMRGEERNIRPGGAAEPTRDKILPRPCRGGSLFGGRSVTGGCARLRLASHRLLSVAPSGAGEHHDNFVQLPARKCPAREDGPSPQSVGAWTLSRGELYLAAFPSRTRSQRGALST